jgi:ElaB/YqjD/DUF883 family membrane-anchored ribosome-binding protein
MSTTYTGPFESTTEKAAGKADEYKHAVQEKIDSGRERMASGLDNSAEAIRNRAHDLPGGERAANLATKAADKLQNAADYLHRHDTEAMVEDVRNVVRKYPTESLLTALALGFVVGMAMRND